MPAHISEAKQQFIKERRLMNWKIGQLLAQIWIPLKCMGNNKNGTWKERFG